MDATVTAAPTMPEPIAAAINSIMAKANGVEKRGRNQFHNYDFAKVEDLLAKLQPAMAEAGLFIVQSEHDIAMLADGRLMKIQYAFRLAHKSGAVWSDPILHSGAAGVFTPKGHLDDKCVNKCHTAARKYFLLGLTQIPVGNMPDTDADAAPGDDAARTNGRQTPDREKPAQNGARAPAAQRNPEPARGGYGRQRNNVDAVGPGHARAPVGDPTAETLLAGTQYQEGLRLITNRVTAALKEAEGGHREYTVGGSTYYPEAHLCTVPALNDAYAAWESWWRQLRPKLSKEDGEKVVKAADTHQKRVKKLEAMLAKKAKKQAADAAAANADPDTGEVLEYEQEGAA